MTKEEIIRVLAPYYEFQEIDLDYSDENELTLAFKVEDKITIDKLRVILEPQYDYMPHMLIASNIVSMVVDVSEPHTA